MKKKQYIVATQPIAVVMKKYVSGSKKPNPNVVISPAETFVKQ